jgi:hypothetical protein
MGDNRDRGIEFGDLPEDLASESYPLSKSALLEQYGDRELEHASGSVRLEDVLSGEGDREFEDAEEVHETILNMVGSAAIGREEYSDRGAGTAEQNGDDAESF